MRRQGKRKFFDFDMASFLVVSKMLINNRFKVDFKEKKKKSWGRLILFAIAFIVITVLFFLFYFITAKLTLFSAIAFVPFAVPSFIGALLLVFGFLSLCKGLTDDLYFSSDNQVLLTYPTNGTTLLLSRGFAYYVYEYFRNIFLQVPLYLGYVICFHYSGWLILWIFLSVALLTLAEMGFASLLSIPLNLFFSFTKKHPVARLVSYLVFYGALIAAAAVLISFIPSHVDIFTNWGLIFSKIQSFLAGYMNGVPFFYHLSEGLIGFSLSGMSALYFKGNGLIVLLLLTLAGIVSAFLSAFIVNPLFLKFASSSFEGSDTELKSHGKGNFRSPFLSSLRKEAMGFIRNPSHFMPFIGGSVFIALLTIVLSKFYSAFNANTLGSFLIEVTEFLVLSLLMLNSSSFLVPLYSQEDGSLSLTRSYPLRSDLLLYSKAFLPSLVGDAAILSSVIFFSLTRSLSAVEGTFLALSVLLIYNGHVLFSIERSSGGLTKGYASESQSMRGGLLISFTAFLFPVAFSLLFFLFLKDGYVLGVVKLFILCLLYFAVSLLSYIRYCKYLFGEGAS